MTARLLVSAGRGPAECDLVVTRLTGLLLAEADAAGLRAVVVEQVPGDDGAGARSVVLEVTGPGADGWAAAQVGPVCWVSASPLRPAHRRKNWFVEASLASGSTSAVGTVGRRRVDPADVRFEPVRGSGPGGQHRNKVATGLRATHLPSRVTVVATDSRSQQANRAEAIRRIETQLAGRVAAARAEADRTQWRRHDEVTRGNPVRRIVAPL